jgi:hypothetical protein
VFPSWSRPTLTEISRCHAACSCQEMLSVTTAGQVELACRAAALDRAASVTAKARARVRAPPSSAAGPSSSAPTSSSASSRGGAGRRGGQGMGGGATRRAARRTIDRTRARQPHSARATKLQAFGASRREMVRRTAAECPF